MKANSMKHLSFSVILMTLLAVAASGGPAAGARQLAIHQGDSVTRIPRHSSFT